MATFPECATCHELITDESELYESRIELHLPDSSVVKLRASTHVEHGIEDHVKAVDKALRPYLRLSERKGNRDLGEEQAQPTAPKPKETRPR